MITDHRFRLHTGRASGRPALQGCSWMGKCRHPEAEHAYAPSVQAPRSSRCPHVFRPRLDEQGILDMDRCAFDGTCNRSPEEHPLTVTGRTVLTISAIVEQ